MRGWFQSAPAITGGRFSQSPALPPTPSSFNPRPPLLAGVSHHVRQLVAHRLVSIRARHYWRAFHVPWLTWLLAHLKSLGVTATGTLHWSGESASDTGTIDVLDSDITVRIRKSPAGDPHKPLTLQDLQAMALAALKKPAA